MNRFSLFTVSTLSLAIPVASGAARTPLDCTTPKAVETLLASAINDAAFQKPFYSARRVLQQKYVNTYNYCRTFPGGGSELVQGYQVNAKGAFDRVQMTTTFDAITGTVDSVHISAPDYVYLNDKTTHFYGATKAFTGVTEVDQLFTELGRDNFLGAAVVNWRELAGSLTQGTFYATQKTEKFQPDYSWTELSQTWPAGDHLSWTMLVRAKHDLSSTGTQVYEMALGRQYSGPLN